MTIKTAANLSSDDIYNRHLCSQPRVFFEIDKNSLPLLRTKKNANGEYLWSPILPYPDTPGRLMGIEILISEEDVCFKKVFLFTDGHMHKIDLLNTVSEQSE